MDRYNLKFIQVTGQGFINPLETNIGKVSHYLQKISQTLSDMKSPNKP
jgi:hypothetical protein